MKLIQIGKIREFTSQLFAGTEFDGYLVSEAQFVTSCVFDIDGHVNKEFVGNEIAMPDYGEGLVPWKKIKPVCFEIIKGKKVPQSFKIVFKLPRLAEESLLEESGVAADADRVSGMYLNITYKKGELSCTSGIALKTFKPDRTIETAWDECAARLVSAYV